MTRPRGHLTRTGVVTSFALDVALPVAALGLIAILGLLTLIF